MAAQFDDAQSLEDRFLVARRLGAGSFGTVFEAIDRTTGARVALKVLSNLSAESLYRFKREFRALADLSDPNIVTLHELLRANDAWLFTMELVDGTDFLTYVHPHTSPARDTDGAPNEPEIRSITMPLTAEAIGRLRNALPQLARGVAVLHRSGKLHRDIKPPNVRVTPEGRVVLLDFGLVTDIGAFATHRSTAMQMVGTVSYMAPEQATDNTLSEASDWYSVGVMLYEALTGRLPFRGGGIGVLFAKQQSEPPPPRTIRAEVPDDLNELCVGLLRRQPQDRLTGNEVLERLGVPRSSVTSATVRNSGHSSSDVFIGRDTEIATLRGALDDVSRGLPVVVLLAGPSGIGKSALVHHFMEGLDQSTTVVLHGRCYAREAVPYKAVDSLVDALTRYLWRLRNDEAASLLPPHIRALAKLFPVLDRVGAVVDAERPLAVTPDPQELRRRAFLALQEILRRMAKTSRVVLWIDDLQWGDLDSLALLTAVFRPPECPQVLLVASYRSEDAAGSRVLRELRAELASHRDAISVRELAVGPLGERQTYELARTLLARRAADGVADDDHAAATIARESAGSPFFVGELTQYLRRGGNGQLAAGDLTLDHVLRERIRALPDPARRLLETVAVSGLTITKTIALEAANVPVGDAEPLAILRNGNLVRSKGPNDSGVETYHDRIREVVLASLSPDALRERHARLANALEASGEGDAQELAQHFLECGDRVKAARYAEKAAHAAVEALAFDRAARLFSLALELRDETADAIRELCPRIGNALAAAGRGEQSAHAFLRAAEHLSGQQALELRRRAADQFLRSGHMLEGVRAAEVVLRDMRMSFPATPQRAVLSFLLARARLLTRGYGFRERPESDVPERELVHVDLCWTLSLGLGIADPIRGSVFQARHLLAALRTGELFRITRAMSAEIGYSAIGGARTARRTAKLDRNAESLAARSANPHSTGFLYVMRGIAAFLEGRFPECERTCSTAEQVLRDGATEAWFEISSAQLFAVRALYWMGEMTELLRRVRVMITEAEERGDLYAATTQRMFYALGLLVGENAPDAAAAQLDAALSNWSLPGFSVPHIEEGILRSHITLLAGDGQASWECLRRLRDGMRSAFFMRVQFSRAALLDMRTRAALLLSVQDRRAGARWLRTARIDIARLERTCAPWALAVARLYRGSIALIERDTRGASEHLDRAIHLLDAVHMQHYAAAARVRLAALTDGARASELRAQADAWFQAQRIPNPVGVTALYAPIMADGGVASYPQR